MEIAGDSILPNNFFIIMIALLEFGTALTLVFPGRVFNKSIVFAIPDIYTDQIPEEI